jgi:serine/threonine-protein kinase
MQQLGYSWRLGIQRIEALSLVNELKRRHVFRVAITYIVVAWLILQVADVLLDKIGVPDWTFKVVLVILVIGFPVAVMLAWAYDMTPSGLKRTEARDESIPQSIGDTPPKVAGEPSRASVAVLPFVNMSGNPENEYFSDGLSEELLNVLAKVSALKVAARTSSFHFKGHTGSIEEIAAKLGVATVLEGSVRQSGKRIRITAQLINAKDGYHLWSETFDRELDDIFEVQDEISRSVVKALKVKLLGEASSPRGLNGTRDAEAFNAYLQGMHYVNQGSDKDALLAAVDAYRKAIDIDPGYAEAYAGLAKALENLATNNFADLDQVVDKAEAAARKSIELAPALAEGHMVLSVIASGYRLDPAVAMKEIDTAISLDPGNVAVLIEYSRLHALAADFETAIDAALTAQELDPVSTAAAQQLGTVLYFARKYDDAIVAYKRALSLNPHYPRPYYGIAMSMFLQGDLEEAARSVAQEPLTWMRFSGLAIVQHKMGDIDAAEEAMASLIESYRDNGLYQQAQVHAQWGDINASVDALLKARDIGDPGVSQIIIDPLIDTLRDDPRFMSLVADVRRDVTRD